MGSQSKDQKSKKTKLGVEGPNTRFVINPKTIRLLDEDQVRKIVEETNSELGCSTRSKFADFKQS